MWNIVRAFAQHMVPSGVLGNSGRKKMVKGNGEL